MVGRKGSLSPALPAVCVSWLAGKIGHGAYIRAGDTVRWLGAVYALQEQLGLKIHIAADTSLQLKSLGHYLPLGGNRTVYLFGDPGTALPNWFRKCAWDVTVVYRRPRLFDGSEDVGFSDMPHERFSVRTASPERAILEFKYLATDNPSLEYSHQLMNGLSGLRPNVRFADRYLHQVRLLIRCLPEMSKHACFALKGGTAINLFVRNMPRISVDIDLAYVLLIKPREESLEEIGAALRAVAEEIRNRFEASLIIKYNIDLTPATLPLDPS